MLSYDESSYYGSHKRTCSCINHISRDKPLENSSSSSSLYRVTFRMTFIRLSLIYSFGPISTITNLFHDSMLCHRSINIEHAHSTKTMILFFFFFFYRQKKQLYAVHAAYPDRVNKERIAGVLDETFSSELPFHL